MKLRSRILLITLPLSVISIIILEMASFYFIESEIKDKLEKEADSIVDVLQSEVELMLGAAASTLEQYGDFPIFEQYSKYHNYGLTEEAAITKKEMIATFERLL